MLIAQQYLILQTYNLQKDKTQSRQRIQREKAKLAKRETEKEFKVTTINRAYTK